MPIIVVIGAGIIGLSCAYALLEDGHQVSIVDRDPAGDKASFGNAGGIGVSEIVPASLPNVVWRMPGWLIDPLGPLSLRPTHLPSLLPFLWRFIRAGAASEVIRITNALAALSGRTYDDLLPMLTKLGLQRELHRVGALTVYRTKAGFIRDQFEWGLKRQHGIICEALDGDQARELEPALGRIVRHAILTPQWSHLADPKLMMDRLREHLHQNGVEIVTGDVQAINSRAVTLNNGHSLRFKSLVIAAGAWSAKLAGAIGDRAILESERGYNTTLPHPDISLSREIIFAEEKFVSTPLSVGLRIGGAAEFAGLNAPANYKRSDTLLELARQYFPGLKAAHGTKWMGHRPTTPDSLPVIGRSRHHSHIFYAFGHGHVGLTFGPTTGRLLADLIAGRKGKLDLTPFSIDRFC